jgi:hypothetical protein
MSLSPEVEVYQFRVCLREISPAIWRRLLLRSDQTIADLHYTLQIAMVWSDLHLNRFVIHGKDFGVAHIGGMSFSDDPRTVKLSDFRCRRSTSWPVRRCLAGVAGFCRPVCLGSRRARQSRSLSTRLAPGR